ncbi:MAG TPA: DUF1775 domain-containing protein [Mycobacteriales bacterium]
MPVSRTRTAGRAASVLLAAAGATVLLAAPALAHVEVSAKPAQAGARDAVVTFDAEGESTTAGITGVRIQLPAGISSSQVTLGSAPAGWRLTTPQGVVTIAGPALAPSRNAVYSIRVARLPASRQLVFKTIVAYSDGHVDRWIDLPTGGEADPPNPAPVLSLAPAAPTTAAPTTAGPTTAPASPAAPATAAPSAAPTTAASSDNGLSRGAGVAIGVVAVVVAIGGVAATTLTRRRSG